MKIGSIHGNVQIMSDSGNYTASVFIDNENPPERALEIAHAMAAAEDLLSDGDHFNRAAWDLVRELMGSASWRVDDNDQSEWAKKMRAFCFASNAHLAAMYKARGKDAPTLDSALEESLKVAPSHPGTERLVAAIGGAE